MSKPNSIRIDDVEYVRADAQPATTGDIMIAVLDRGFVYIGRVEHTDTGITLRNAKNIRVWGTTKGLGELVNGPTKSTQADAVGTVHVPSRAIISLIEVVAESWKGI
jgi:hypothetical protein